jgi:AraC-like DNA-binding protein
MRVNPNYLSALFKRETGLTLTQYIQAMKIEEAKRLMLSREHSLGNIADMLGFSSLSYFSRVFKRLCRISPRAYIEAARTAPAQVPDGGRSDRGIPEKSARGAALP